MPRTPPYSVMINNPAIHSRSNSYSIDNVYDTGALRPRAYSSSVFDYGYASAANPMVSPVPLRMPTTPNRRAAILPRGPVTPPGARPYEVLGVMAHSPPTSFSSPQQSRHSRSESTRELSRPIRAQSPALGLPMGQPVGQSNIMNQQLMQQLPARPPPLIPNAQLQPQPSYPPTYPAYYQPSGDLLTYSELYRGSSDVPVKIYTICKTQSGCREIQNLLHEGGPGLICTIYAATLPYMAELMMDPFGNYFCQKLIERCTADQLTHLLKVIRGNIVDIALGQYGTRALQKLVENVSAQEQVNILVNTLDPSVLQLIFDINGNHVIQKFLVKLNGRRVQFIYDSIYPNVRAVSTHRHGCRVLQRCLDNSTPTNKHLLVTRITANTRELVGNQYGNYVCQCVVDLDVPEFTRGIISRLLGSLTVFSMQKYSSNVVEKCLRASNQHQKLQMMQELMTRENVKMLLLDPYGNYVLQTALEIASEQDQDPIIQAVQQRLFSTLTRFGPHLNFKLRTLGAAAAAGVQGNDIDHEQVSEPAVSE